MRLIRRRSRTTKDNPMVVEIDVIDLPTCSQPRSRLDVPLARASLIRPPGGMLPSGSGKTFDQLVQLSKAESHCFTCGSGEPLA
jgi:hypothetical protein